jgi:hypothetical protein
MHRFSAEVNLEREVDNALRDLERGERPAPSDFAALLCQLVFRKDPRISRALSVMRDRLPEEVSGQTQESEEGSCSDLGQEGLKGEK